MAASSTQAGRGPALLAAIAAVVSVVAVFLPWYSTDPQSRVSNIDGRRGDLSMWTVHEAMRWVLLVLVVLMALMTLAALLRPEAGRGMSDPIMVLAVNAIGIVLYFGFLYRPGSPMQTISLASGYFLAMGGTLVPLVVYALQAKTTMRRSASPIGSRTA